MSFQHKLSKLFAEDILSLDTPVPDNALTLVKELAKKLIEAKQNIADLEHHYDHACEQLSKQLTQQLNKSQPKLSAKHQDGNCSICYGTRSLVMKPDINNDVWVVNSPNETFASRFRKKHSSAICLDDDFKPMVQAIVQYFTDHYHTL